MVLLLSPPANPSHVTPLWRIPPPVAPAVLSPGRPPPNPNSSYPPLPPFPSVSRPTFKWGNTNGTEFVKILDDVYAEVIHWRRNCFTVPFGKAGKSFVSELSRLYLAFGSSSSVLEAVALKAATVFPILLLQKPSRASKTKDHINCLERRLASWSNGDLNELMMEGRVLQLRLPKLGFSKANNNLARNFANLMFMGKCKAALDLLSKEEKGGILHLDDPADPNSPNSPTVRDVLVDKHPPGQHAYCNCIISS